MLKLSKRPLSEEDKDKIQRWLDQPECQLLRRALSDHIADIQVELINSNVSHSPDAIAAWDAVPGKDRLIKASLMHSFIETLDDIRSGKHPLYRVTELTVK